MSRRTNRFLFLRCLRSLPRFLSHIATCEQAEYHDSNYGTSLRSSSDVLAKVLRNGEDLMNAI